MQQAPLMTRWAGLVDTNAPLPEYPRPQMVRTNWLNLNGLWQFQPGATNDAVPFGQTLQEQILVPFPMESAISGVMQYHEFSWYRKLFTIPSTWGGGHVLLHLDAVTWRATVYLNGHLLGVHSGGYDPFAYDLAPYLNGATNELIVGVYSPEDNGGQPRGKQTLYPGGIMYTSSSGIWQPAWLEPVDGWGISSLKMVPDVDKGLLRLTVNTFGVGGLAVSASVFSNGVPVLTAFGTPGSELALSISNASLWSPENPFLYDLKIVETHNGITNDEVSSYFGMRKISTNIVNGVPEIYLNNQPYFEMGPLDQGFWPDGIYTAPTDAALEYDLQQEKALGFNMVRKHIKVERQRWYYWADKLGLLVWQDMPSGNSYTSNPKIVDPFQFMAELTAMVTNHWNSPCIIMWDTFNEGQGQTDANQTNTPYLVQMVKTLDPSRLVNEASGGAYFGAGDVFDQHSYPPPGDPTSSTQAPVDGEYGGIGFQQAGHLWNPALAGGNYVGANTTNDIATIYDSFSDQLVNNKTSSGLNAAVYTQITDVENECNGLMTYDRYLKPSMAAILASNLKARMGQSYLNALLPTSQEQGRLWNYITNTPPSNWYETNFDDSAWGSGLAGFGTPITPNAVVRTLWNTGDIWLRQKFVVGSLTPQDRSQFVFNLFHDEGCEIYLNGVLAGSASGYVTSYVLLPCNAAGMAALVPNATNLIAVHCHQTTGGQDIDVGLYKQFISANALMVPTDMQGYWPLDETNGNTAADATGSGNNGVVTGAAWSPDGKVNGCLVFNGVNQNVEVNNTVGGDFSLSFWVQTTQAAGTGAWWQGAGLVDAFASANDSDFGAALCGGHFAFGVGSPDATLLSTSAINDGAWHQCVATRKQATGAMVIYVDGVIQAVGTGSTAVLNASPVIRFGSLANNTGFFAGKLDDVRIYDRALGSNEVQALYDNSVSNAPAPAPLTALSGNNQVFLGWTGVPGATGYDIRRSSSLSGPFLSVANPFATNTTDFSALNGNTYYYEAAAQNALGDGSWTAPVRAAPSLSASLTTWFAADHISGLTNLASVTDWPDLSGNGDDALQPAPQFAPILVTNGLNGLPVVRFDSAASNNLAFLRPVQDDFTMFCVFRSTQGYGNGTLYYQGAGLVNGEVSGVTEDFGTCLFSNGQVSAGTGNPDVAVDSVPGFNDGQPHLLVFKRTESTGECDLYMDGNFMGSVTGSSLSLTAPSRLVLGSQQTMLYYYTGDIAEVKIYDSALSDADRQAQEAGLIQKWGIQTLPPPASLNATGGNGHVEVSWPVVSGAMGYQLLRSSTLTGPFEVLSMPVTNEFDDAQVVNGSTYYYEVRSMSPVGQSSVSQVASATPQAPRPAVWYKADAVTGLAQGAALGAWPDSSGNGIYALQTNVNQRPVYETNALHGLPAIRFDSAASTFLYFQRPVQDDFTMLVVYQSSQSNQGNGTNFYNGSGLVNGDQPMVQNDFGTALNANGQVLAGTGNPDTSLQSPGGFNDGQPHIMAFERTASSGALALFVDGVQVDSGVGGTQSLTSPATLDLGAVPSGGGFLDGDLAEVKIFSSALSGGDLVVEENQLACKYGLSLGVPALASPGQLSGAVSNGVVTLNWSAVSGASSYSVSSSTNATGPYASLGVVQQGTSLVIPQPNFGRTNYYEVTSLNQCQSSPASAPLAVFQPAPSLVTLPTGHGSLNVQWPLWAAGWNLFYSTNLTPATLWMPVTNAVTQLGNMHQVSIVPGGGSVFFRLAPP